MFEQSRENQGTCLVRCPHCNSGRIKMIKPGSDVVVVLACPVCRGLIVVFHNQVIALDRSIIEKGSITEFKGHLADVIVKLIGSESFLREHCEVDKIQSCKYVHPENISSNNNGKNVGQFPAITQQEVDYFAQYDLQRLDDPSYFKKHFG